MLDDSAHNESCNEIAMKKRVMTALKKSLTNQSSYNQKCDRANFSTIGQTLRIACQ